MKYTKESVIKMLKGMAKSLNENAEASLEEMAQDAVNKVLRKGEFDTQLLYGENLGVKEEVLRKADDLYITATILSKPVESLKLWKAYGTEMSELRKAMSTSGTAVGTEWIPTGFSKELQRRVRLALKVGALHRWIPMPTSPYKLPIDGADAEAYLIPEALKDESVKIKSSTPGTSNLTFTAKKLAARSLFSEEVTEDSIVPILPFIKEKIVNAMVIAIEKCTINGDTTSTHFDSNVVNSFDFQKAFKGYRRLAYDNNGTTYDAWLAGTGTITTDLQNIRTAMDVYGVDPAKLVWVTSLLGYNTMKNNADVYTVDKYGPKAVILKGELGRFENIPIVVSEYVYRNQNSSGVYASGGTKTSIICVYKEALAYGDRRKMTLKTKEDIETDQTVLVTTQRLDFKSMQASAYPVVGVLYNI